MAEIHSEKEKKNIEKDMFDILRDVKVAVRRPDSTSVENVNLGFCPIELNMYLKMSVLILAEEYLNFLKSFYPDYKTKLVSVPRSFQYSVKTHGIPSEGKKLLKERKKKKRKKEDGEQLQRISYWVQDTTGKWAEEKIFNKLTSMFSDEPCLLVSGFTEADLLKVVRENFQKERIGSEMSEQVSTITRLFYIALVNNHKN